MGSVRKLNVAHRDIMSLLLHLSRYHNVCDLSVTTDVPAFQAVISNLIFKFITKYGISDLPLPYSDIGTNYCMLAYVLIMVSIVALIVVL